jgi:heme exporter protein A
LSDTEVGIEAVGLAARRGGRMVFADLSFSLRGGGALRITGPNGIGKSTLLRLCARLLTPAAGQITLTVPPGVPRIGYLNEAAALDGERPLAAALAFWARLDGLPDPDARVAAALADVALADLAAVPARMLSTGQRRRAAFARVIAGGAALWLLDEPTNGLDDAAAARLEVLVERHLEAGGMAIVATHLPLRLPAMRTLAFGTGAFGTPIPGTSAFGAGA